MTELAFIKSIKNNEPESFRKLVLNYQGMIINTCYGFVKNHTDAEDIAQEVFIEVYRSINKFREDAKLTTWLYRISVNKSIDFLRKQKRKSWIGSIQTMFGGEEKAMVVEAKHQPNPQQVLEQGERKIVLQNAIDKLAENQKTAFVLHKYEGLSYKEIAKIMDLSLSSVESLMHRAKKNLKKLLYDYYQETMKS
jgi:RNA polymerase sigma-70 factor (ECF subfamily)